MKTCFYDSNFVGDHVVLPAWDPHRDVTLDMINFLFSPALLVYVWTTCVLSMLNIGMTDSCSESKQFVTV